MIKTTPSDHWTPLNEKSITTSVVSFFLQKRRIRNI